MKPVGAVVKLTVLWWDLPTWPEPGDFLRTESGRCYRIDLIHRSRPTAARLGTFTCTVLGDDAVALDAPGVFPWSFAARVRSSGRRGRET